MSVTFWCPAAPRRKVDCYCKQHDEPCDAMCQGYELVSEGPEVNLASYNAANIIQLLGLPMPDGELYGEIPASQIPRYQQRLLHVFNVARRRAHLVEPAETHSRIIYAGNTDEQTLRRLDQIRELFTYAQQHGYNISWG